MGTTVMLPLLTTVVSLAFGFMVFDQFRRRHRPYQGVWTIGLLMYAVGAGSEYAGNLSGWSINLYRVWYIAGAFFVAAYLGMGTVYLVAPRRVAHTIFAVLAIGSVYAAYRVFGAPVDTSLLPAANEAVSGKALPADVRILTPIFNVFGAGALVLGAAYSAFTFWRKGILGHRVLSNVLIAVGAFVPSMTGTLSRFGLTDALLWGELIGVVVIFSGFLVSIEVFERNPRPANRQPLVSKR